MNDAEMLRELTEKSGARRHAQNLTAFVKAARRTDPVGNRRLAALRAFAQLRQFQHAVVGAAHALPAR
jgi:hypothetical protein